MKTEVEKRIEEKAKAVLLGNRKSAVERGVKYGFTCPSVTLYHWQWLWDSCFHSIALRWFDPEFAKGEIVSLLSGQWRDGRVPNMVHVGWNWRFDRMVHGTMTNTSGITQPPLIADAAMRAHRVAPDKAFLEAVYPKLVRYYDWLRTAREDNGDGLPAIYHPWESGIDNSTRWDTVFDIKGGAFNRKAFDLVKGRIMFRFNFARYDNEKMRRVSPYFVKGIDMACYYRANLLALAAMARELGREDDALDHERRAENTKAAVLSRMWSEADGRFGDLLGEELRLSAVPTPFSFLPMWAGIATPEQTKRIVEEIADPKRFWTEYPLPTTAADYHAFDPNQYWRGTVWINVNWLITEALAKSGFTDMATELKERTLALVDKSGFMEYYNPFTGAGLGTKNFGWSTLVIDMINRDYEKEFNEGAAGF